MLGQGAEARDKVLELLVAQTEVPLPESAVQAEIEWREHDVVHQLGHDDAAFERYLQTEGKTREEFTAELREVAEKAVKTQFILDSIADAEAVAVSDAELTEYIVRQAQRYNMAPQEFADQIVQAGNIAALVADVRRNKALATVLESASVTDASGNPVDLSALSTPQGQADLDELEDAVEQAAAAAEAAERRAVRRRPGRRPPGRGRRAARQPAVRSGGLLTRPRWQPTWQPTCRRVSVQAARDALMP